MSFILILGGFKASCGGPNIIIKVFLLLMLYLVPWSVFEDSNFVDTSHFSVIRQLFHV